VDYLLKALNTETFHIFIWSDSHFLNQNIKTHPAEGRQTTHQAGTSLPVTFTFDKLCKARQGKEILSLLKPDNWDDITLAA
jgi:hypothetical protein